MKFTESPVQEIKFSKEEIYEQLQRIFSDPTFAGSDILKRFLVFIVDQTLAGHSNWLKEYTIGVQVLHKPTDFNPQESGIVRIHAGRLRRALHHYYSESGAEDTVYIAIPKGSYIPAFMDNGVKVNEENGETKPVLLKSVTIAVMPFMYSKSELRNSFTDGLCIQLSNELTHFENLSVIAYNIIRNLSRKFNDLKEIASLVEAQYIITGTIQSIKDKVRISVEMIQTNTNRQIWSQLYERKFSEANFFELQDEIAKLVISGLAEFCSVLNTKSQRSVMAVA